MAKSKTVTKDAAERAVVVTTEHRGVFFGYVGAEYKPGDATMILKRCRLCIHWSADVKGFMGLAATGPTSGCRIGPSTPDFEVRKVTGVASATDEAIKAWEAAPWSR